MQQLRFWRWLLWDGLCRRWPLAWKRDLLSCQAQVEGLKQQRQHMLRDMERMERRELDCG